MPSGGDPVAAMQTSGNGNSRFAEQRAEMVRTQIRMRGIKSPEVLDVMERVPREEFVPEEMRSHAYEDRALPIGHRATISQPYIVALMTELLDVKPWHRVLEIGTGSGGPGRAPDRRATSGSKPWREDPRRAIQSVVACGAGKRGRRRGDGARPFSRGQDPSA